MKTAALALALLLPLALPAAAQQTVSPDAAGVWGFAYSELEDGRSPQALAAQDVISCYAEPALITAAAGGYVLNAYRVDVSSLASGTVRYYLQFENLCSYDPATGLESCQRIADPSDKSVYWTWYQPLDAALGIYQAHVFVDDDAVEAFRASGTPPASTQRFVTFRCPDDRQPRRQLLQEATRDNEKSEASYDLMMQNFGTCGYPLCGADGQRLRDLVGK